MRILIVLLLTTLPLSCAKKDPDETALNFNYACDLSTSYTPRTAALEFPATGTAKATAIILHGKTGSPQAPFLITLREGLNANNYNVVGAYMPWSGLQWDGTVCQGIAYLNTLIEMEQAKSNKVIVIAHSLGAPIAAAHAALDNTSKPDAYSLLAPGHFIHQSNVLAAAHASSIGLAKTMIAEGQGDSIASFETSNGGTIQNLSTTPRIYLSYHDEDQFPNIEAALPKIDTSTLWLTGNQDNLTEVANKFGLVELLPKSNGNRYKVISGDHYSIMSLVPTEMDSWFSNLPQ